MSAYRFVSLWWRSPAQSIKHIEHLQISPRSIAKDCGTVIEYVVFDSNHGATLTQTREFNDLVNMTAGELEEWSKDEQSEVLGRDK